MNTPDPASAFLSGVTFPMWQGDSLRWPRDVLDVVGARTRDERWLVEVTEAAGDREAAAAMDRLGERDGRVPDRELRDVAAGDVQLVDATLTVGEPPRLVIRAVDSTEWDVLSDDPALLDELRERFAAVDLPPDAIRPVSDPDHDVRPDR